MALPAGQIQFPALRVALGLQEVQTRLFVASRPQVAHEKWHDVQTPVVLRLVPGVTQVHTPPARTAELSQLRQFVVSGPLHRLQLGWQAAQLPLVSKYAPSWHWQALLGSRYAPALHSKHSAAVGPKQLPHELWQATQLPAAFW